LFDVQCKISASGKTGSLVATLSSAQSNSQIMYAVEQHGRAKNFIPYSTPLEIDSTCILHTYNATAGKSRISSQVFELHQAVSSNVKLVNAPDERYAGNGSLTLVDGIQARLPWVGYEWLGFFGEDLEAMIDLGSEKKFTSVTAGFLENEASWIYFPSEISCYVWTLDGAYQMIETKTYTAFDHSGERIITFTFPEQSSRYVKVMAKNRGIIPPDKPGAGHPAWLFTDEIQVR
jgi:hexosaminidase